MNDCFSLLFFFFFFAFFVFSGLFSICDIIPRLDSNRDIFICSSADPSELDVSLGRVMAQTF
ncbi:hypothetical protein BDV23DRAFT_145240 [Aspergillus alliaceus]|uniref:Uncharacterized protein n=1 Tax=Petromyces alliaceus TaxID=209559 RepID=A0A5N7CQ00_PETAA|nr:hypothetical protein BDV23DRAFT_145240 [Aspergillus alliaceus]